MINDSQDMTYDHRKELQVALRNFITDMNLPLFITISFNTEMTYRRAVKVLNELQKNLDRKMFGRRFFKKSKDDRIFFIAVPEHFNSNLHFHKLLKIPKHKELFFIFNAWFYLRQLVPSATIQISRLTTAEDVRATSFYSCKDAINSENYNKFVISTQFASFKKR